MQKLFGRESTQLQDTDKLKTGQDHFEVYVVLFTAYKYQIA